MSNPLVANDLEIMQCGTCGVVHAIPRTMHATAQREGGFWHCQSQAKRSAASACPCCKRTFRQLARHMAAKHPEHGL